MKQGRIAALVGATLMTVGLVAACGASYSQTDVQDKLAQDIKGQTGTEVTVTCPADVAVANGGTFTCAVAAADGTNATVTATFTDDQGSFDWEITG
jgi:hypothetical protein